MDYSECIQWYFLTNLLIHRDVIPGCQGSKTLQGGLSQPVFVAGFQKHCRVFLIKYWL